MTSEILPITTMLAVNVTQQDTYIFTRQEVHGPLDVLDGDTAADVRLCGLNPHFSKQVHHT